MAPKRSSKKSPVAEKWVVNASPVIALARIGQVGLLTQLPAQAVIPRAVADELLQAPQDDAARCAVESNLFRVVRTPIPPPELLARDLGKGETSVLAYALANAGWVVVIDDAAARRCARSFALPMIGTLSVVILARQHGLIESAAQVLRSLRGVGLWLDDRIIREALARTVGEEWTSHCGQ
jgi:predicted nucleic acid-binding protein